MNIFKRAVRKVLNESYSCEYTVVGEPDYFDIYKGDEAVGCCEYTCEDAVPFIICNGKMYTGDFGYGHPSCNEPDNAEEYDDFIEGRLWIKVPSSCNGNEDFDEYYSDNPYEQNDDETYFPYSVLTFWSGDEEKLVNKELIEKLLSDYGIDKSEVLVAPFNEGDYSSMYSYDEWSFEVEKANERQKKARAIHLMNAEDKHDATSDFRSNRDKLIGKKLTDKNGVEMPLAKYYSMIRSESKKSKNAKQIT
jgi:hypothetical protein